MDGSYDGKVIDDTFTLSEFVNWLRKSSRDVAGVLLSEDARGKPIVPIDEVRRVAGTRAVTVRLSNAVQDAARDHLGTVNPYRSAARVFPPGDAWCDEPRLVGCAMPSLSALRFLDRIDELLDRRLPTRRKPPANMIAHTIAGARRECPCILVSLGVGMTNPYLNVDALLDGIESAAVVFEITDRAADDWLRDHLPPWACAYNGACRFLAPSSFAGPGRSRLLRMYSAADSAHVVDELTERVLNVAYPEGYRLGVPDEDDAQPQSAHEVQSNGAPTEGVVAMMLDDVAYITIDDERSLRKAALDVPPSLDAAPLLHKGQAVRGHPDGSGRFHHHPRLAYRRRRAARLRRRRHRGRPHHLRMRGHVQDHAVPGARRACGRRSGRARGGTVRRSGVDVNADLRPMLNRGQKIALRVEERDGDDWLLSLPGTDDTVLPAPSLLPGGPAWLGVGAAFDYLPRLRAHSTLADVPVERLLATVDTLDAAHATIRRMHAQVVDLSQNNRRLNDAVGKLREDNAKLNRDNRDYEKALEDGNPLAAFSGRFASPREELDWQLHAQSLLQFTVEERGNQPLAQWAYADEFLDSLAECEHGDMSRRSLIHTMLFVLTGRETANGLRQHPLRTGRGGDNPSRKDDQGNVILRRNVHGQYRLHFTRDGAGRVTFISVNAHDDLLL
ncbi:hypothetical protein B1400_0374 [Bifidobacterium italicum]|uniref:Uncharacterized protein n=1 Tax=Bifidobacterium italicum TaxID=1960968 RepID=A0A2A2EL01_9BIFI|nr:hypothetical protein [Bifidobacterium italicum]PAU69839.1 hypothetical protein B1400_0374 [Bifidobacterium italicum]